MAVLEEIHQVPEPGAYQFLPLEEKPEGFCCGKIQLGIGEIQLFPVYLIEYFHKGTPE